MIAINVGVESNTMKNTTHISVGIVMNGTVANAQIRNVDFVRIDLKNRLIYQYDKRINLMEENEKYGIPNEAW